MYDGANTVAAMGCGRPSAPPKSTSLRLSNTVTDVPGWLWSTAETHGKKKFANLFIGETAEHENGIKVAHHQPLFAYSVLGNVILVYQYQQRLTVELRIFVSNIINKVHASQVKQTLDVFLGAGDPGGNVQDGVDSRNTPRLYNCGSLPRAAEGAAYDGIQTHVWQELTRLFAPLVVQWWVQTSALADPSFVEVSLTDE